MYIPISNNLPDVQNNWASFSETISGSDMRDALLHILT